MAKPSKKSAQKPATPVTPKTPAKQQPSKPATRAASRQSQTPAGKARKQTARPATPIPWFWIAVVGLSLLGVLLIVIYRITYVPPLLSNVSVQQAHERYEAGAYLLDVREQSEWDDFHIPGTTLIPLGELPNRMNEIPQDREIVIVCRTGNRSEEGRDILRNAGFNRVSSMDGGVMEWRAAGFPIEAGPTP
jgi:rhodanese-related sulfurtransferase